MKYCENDKSTLYPESQRHSPYASNVFSKDTDTRGRAPQVYLPNEFENLQACDTQYRQSSYFKPNLNLKIAEFAF